MFPALKKRRDNNQGFRSAVRATAIRVADRKQAPQLPYYRPCTNDMFDDGSPSPTSIGNTQSELIAAMQKQLDLQDRCFKEHIDMHKQLLQMQRRQLVLLEAQNTGVPVRPPSPEVANDAPSQKPEKVPRHEEAKIQIQELEEHLPGPSQTRLPRNDPHPTMSLRQESPPATPHSQQPSADDNEQLEPEELEDEALEIWKLCNGLHTVDEWVLNYRKHPAGWAALLMIHGIPEVTTRLRSKVENFAIYSALFLSVSLPAAYSKPSSLCEDLSSTDLECKVRTRLYAYSIIAGIVSNTFSILLAMSFVNALNETARDSDVFRMFARGQGYKSTVKCELAFSLGLIFNLVAMVVCVQKWVGWDAVAVLGVTSVLAVRIYRRASKLMFTNASIVKYWRPELGGKPDVDDPYDLDIPVQLFKERADLAHRWKLDPAGRVTSVGVVDTRTSAIDKDEDERTCASSRTSAKKDEGDAAEI